MKFEYDDLRIGFVGASEQLIKKTFESKIFKLIQSSKLEEVMITVEVEQDLVKQFDPILREVVIPDRQMICLELKNNLCRNTNYIQNGPFDFDIFKKLESISEKLKIGLTKEKTNMTEIILKSVQELEDTVQLYKQKSVLHQIKQDSNKNKYQSKSIITEANQNNVLEQIESENSSIQKLKDRQANIDVEISELKTKKNKLVEEKKNINQKVIDSIREMAKIEQNTIIEKQKINELLQLYQINQRKIQKLKKSLGNVQAEKREYQRNYSEQAKDLEKLKLKASMRILKNEFSVSSETKKKLKYENKKDKKHNLNLQIDIVEQKKNKKTMDSSD